MTRQELIDVLREKNFYFKRQAKRTQIWRQRGGLRHVAVPDKRVLSRQQAGVVLYQAGLSKEEIVVLVGSSSSTRVSTVTLVH